jgi:hypothetical protein
LMHWTFFLLLQLSLVVCSFSSSTSSLGNLMIYFRYKWLKPLLTSISKDTLLLLESSLVAACRVTGLMYRSLREATFGASPDSPSWPSS